jgi:hypothetical protein
VLILLDDVLSVSQVVRLAQVVLLRVALVFGVAFGSLFLKTTSADFICKSFFIFLV